MGKTTGRREFLKTAGVAAAGATGLCLSAAKAENAKKADAKAAPADFVP